MKKILITIMMVLSVFTMKVNAQECVYGLQSPNLPYPPKWVKGRVYNITTSKSSCRGDQTAVYFDSGDYFPFTSASFYVEARLVEDDPAAYEPDEEVKRYEGYISAYHGVEWILTNTYVKGNIDSSGDQTCELYMKFKQTDNYNQPLEDNLFRYTMCMN